MSWDMKCRLPCRLFPGVSGGGAQLLLDSFPADNAYSVSRKLRTDYAGAAIRVREDGGGTEADIGFDGNDLDESALSAHVGSNSGFVTKIYDQQGSIDAVQVTAANQLRIVNAGTIEKVNGKPAGFANAAGRHAAAAAINGNANFGVFTTFLVFGRNSISDASRGIFAFGSAGTNDKCVMASDSTLRFAGDFLSATETLAAGQNIRTTLKTSGDLYSEWYNDVLVMDALSSLEAVHDDAFLGGDPDAGVPPNQFFQEVIIYLSDESANQATIEANQNDYFGVFV